MNNRLSFFAAAAAPAPGLPAGMEGFGASAAQQAAPATAPLVTPLAPAGAPASAPEADASVLQSLPDLNFSWSGYFEALAILCFVLALFWGALWLLKRRNGGFFTSQTATMRIENRLALGPKKWLLLVHCLDKKLIIGVTDKSITLVSELPPDKGQQSISPQHFADEETDEGLYFSNRASRKAKKEQLGREDFLSFSPQFNTDKDNA